MIEEAELKLSKIYQEIDHKCFVNSEKVINAFHKNNLSEIHFNSTTGYGYNDIGRDVIESIYADIFKAEDALVRSQFISGSHALNVTLFGLLRPGDTLLSITGLPYDTLHEVIGIKENESSLKSFGINYEQIDLVNNEFNYEEIEKKLKEKKIKVIEIQRSRGYALRKSITIKKLKEVIEFIKQIDSEVIIMVDNCYCEFVDTVEPIEIGADIAVGSLIKNLGAGISPNGAYVVGRKDLIKLVGERLTLPGEGKDVGPTLGINKSIIQGLYMAPSVVAASLKTAVLTSYILANMGYQVDPKYDEERADIVEAITFNNPEDLIHYIEGIQAGSAVDASALPIPTDMPGYDDQIIMASGSFTQGSSIELSCDGPIRPPYIAFQQGSLTYEYGKIGLQFALDRILEYKK